MRKDFFMINSRFILIYLSVLYEGDFNKIFDFIINHEDFPPDEDIMNVVRSVRAHTLTILDPDYPEYLKKIYKPPLVLYYYGDISLIKDYQKNIAIVGSRKCTSYGTSQTREIIAKIAHKYNVVSGMALGIDSCAHNACIFNKGKTIAVLGSGIDYCYPTRNKTLYNEIKRNHLIISEYPNNLVPKEENFPFRNRLIVGLSTCVTITEAKLYSGTSITATIALDEGRDVCCVPYIADKTSLCNSLIKEGAVLIEDGDDLLSFLSDNVTKPIFEL